MSLANPSRIREKKRKTQTPVVVLAAHAIDAALEKKAQDIVVLDMREVSGVADYFVICSADVDLQIKAIAEGVDEHIRTACGERPWHREGLDHRHWVLLDYVDLVVHVFQTETRAFYDLERLWGDAPMERVPDDAASSADVRLLQPSSSS